MLAYVLAVVVGLGSFAFFINGFFYPGVHRKHDFIWSGVGMFYALVLWVCAGQIRGAILLSHLASVLLLGWFFGQVWQLRWQLLPRTQREQVPDPRTLAQVLRDQAKPIKPPSPQITTATAEITPSLISTPPIEAVVSEPIAPIPTEPPIPEPIAPTLTEPPIPKPVVVASPPTPNAAAKPIASAPTTKHHRQLDLSPSTLISVLNSLKAGTQQLFQNLLGKKPKRPTIVIDRSQSSGVTPKPAAQDPISGVPNPEEIPVSEVGIPDEESLLNNEVAPDPEAIDRIVQPTEFAADGEITVGEVVHDPSVDLDDWDEEDIEVAIESDGPTESSSAITEAGKEINATSETSETSAVSDAIECDPAETSENADVNPDSDIVPELMRPHAPSPDLVEAAIQDAIEKHQPTDPPEITESSP